MLQLTRKVEEKIVIGNGPDAITLTVVEIGRHHVRLGVTAARHIPVWREEIAPDRKAAAEARQEGVQA